MAVLPISRNVRVTLTRNARFATRRGFGVPLLLTSDTVAGVLDAAKPIFYAGSIDEVAAHWDAGDAPYDAALAAFSQNPQPLQIAFGYYSATAYSGAANDAAKEVVISNALDALQDYDTGWYWIDVEPALRDEPALDALVAWVEARTKMAVLTSNNDLLKDPDDTTNVAARHKGTVERTAVFYHPTEALYPGFALAALLGTYSFDNADAAYTAKYKGLAGITPINILSNEAQAVDGFVPALGQSAATGHLANIYVDMGGVNQVEQGSTLTANVFIDEIHSGDWIVARTEEEMLNVLRNNARVPFTDGGMETLASAPRIVMQQAQRAGLIADDLNPETGNYEPAIVIEVPSYADVPESQRKARVAPVIRTFFRAAGAVHYAQADFQVRY